MKQWVRRSKRAIKTAFLEQQWLLPLAGTIVGALLALVVANIDRQPDPNDWAVTVARARDTMMSILAILFAGLAIVLSLATITAQTVASRFSLRLLRVHLRGMADKVVIAIFTMTTTYIIIEQLRMVSLSADDLAPPATVFVAGILLCVSSLAIIWHINHTLQSIRVDRIIRSVTAATRRTAASVAREHDKYGSAATVEFTAPETAQSLVSAKSGHVVAVEIGDVVEIADRDALIVCVSAVVGTTLVSGETLGWVEGSGATPIPIETRRAIVDAISVEPARDPLTDVGLGVRILVDIALMAVSPAINDPYTAVQSIEQLAILLTDVAGRRTGGVSWTDQDTGARVLVNALTLGDYLDDAVSPILTYAGHDETVIAVLARLVRLVEHVATEDVDRDRAQRLAIRVAEAARDAGRSESS
jgi:uncharacterized membrane protein